MLYSADINIFDTKHLLCRRSDPHFDGSAEADTLNKLPYAFSTRNSDVLGTVSHFNSSLKTTEFD